MPSCPAGVAPAAGPPCYAPVTVPALLAYVVAGIGGAILTGVALRRLF
jgi:hypothetical protein